MTKQELELEQWIWILKRHHKDDLILELDALDGVELLGLLEELKMRRERESNDD